MNPQTITPTIQPTTTEDKIETFKARALREGYTQKEIDEFLSNRAKIEQRLLSQTPMATLIDRGGMDAVEEFQKVALENGYTPEQIHKFLSTSQPGKLTPIAKSTGWFVTPLNELMGKERDPYVDDIGDVITPLDLLTGGVATLGMIRPVSEGIAKVTRPVYKTIGKGLEKITPEFVKKALIYRYGQPTDYAKLAEERLVNIGVGQEEAIEWGQRLSKGLSHEEQLELGRIITGKQEITTPGWMIERLPSALREPIEHSKKLEEIADPIIKKFVELGERSVNVGLLKEETFFKNYGKYMPRLYKKYEYDKLLVKTGTTKPTRLDLQRFMQRKDIPEEIRLMMGEILEPGYPVAKGLAQLTYDVETAEFFQKIADNPLWTLSDEMFAEKGLAESGQYIRMPDSKKLGALRNKYVLKTIAEDINDIVRTPESGEILWRQLIGAWKFGKVIINPATHSRNLMSNAILADLGGLPPYRVDIYREALVELVKRGDIYREARATGLLGTTFYQQELQDLLTIFDRAEGDNLLTKSASMVKELANRAGNIYQAEEQWFKLAKYIHNRKLGLGVKEAADDAEKWLFNYGKVTPFIKKLRTEWWGMPFASFSYFALPRIAEASMVYPLRFWKYPLIFQSAVAHSLQALDITEKDWERIKATLPKHIRQGQFLLLPYRDNYDQIQFLDLTYILPWGDLGELNQRGLLGFMGNPFYKASAEIMTNKVAYTDQPIWKESDSPKIKTQKIFDYLYKLFMPSFAPEIPGLTKGGYSWQKMSSAALNRPDYFGRLRPMDQTILSSFFGLKISPINIEEVAKFKTLEEKRSIEDIQKQKTSLTFQAQNIRKAKDIPEKQRWKRLREIGEEIHRLDEEIKKIQEAHRERLK